MRLRAGSTAKNPSFRSGRQCAAALTAPVGHDEPPGPGTHPQPEAMHAGTPPVIRLEGPLALGHGILLVVSGSSLASSGRSRFASGSVGGGPATGRRGPQATPFWFAAVSPTFGRLFEGTDEPCPGQTWTAPTNPSNTFPTFVGKVTLAGRNRKKAPNDPKQPNLNAAELLAAARKTVSFGQCRFILERSSTTKRGWRIDWPPRLPPTGCLQDGDHVPSPVGYGWLTTILSTPVYNYVDSCFVV